MIQRYEACGQGILLWYQTHQRDLPWRHTRDPYKIWISEIMLQQTRVDTVVGYYHRFIERFPDIQTLAAAEIDEVLTYWKGLGYYTRAKNLYRAARDLMQHFDGSFPNTFIEVKALPGIGEYTAGAILSIAFNQSFPAVDGNVLRVIARLDGLEEDISMGKTRNTISCVVKKMIPEGFAGDFTQGLMELGAMICVPGTPNCQECPARGHCTAYGSGLQEVLPVKKKKMQPSPELEYWVARIESESGLLMEYREHETLLGQMWGLPMAQKNMGLSAEKAMDNKYGLILQKLETLGSVTHIFTHRVWKMEIAAYSLGKEVPLGRGLQWVDQERLPHMAIPTAFQKVLQCKKS